MLSQPHVQIILLQVLLVTGTHPSALVRLFLCTQAGAASCRHLQGANETGACSSSPAALLIAWPCIQPSSAPSPGSCWDPNSSWGVHIYKPCTGSSYKRCRRTQDPEKAPIPLKATNDDTSKENLVSLSVSSNIWEMGAQLSLQSWAPKRDRSTPRNWELGANSSPL